MASVTGSLRQNFLAGLLVILPFGLTAFILYKLGKWIINLVSAAPAKFLKPLQELPQYAFQLTTFSIGLLGTLLIVLIIGAIARNFIGRKFVSFGENMISRIPLARTVYIATKQIMETLFFATGMKNLKRVAMFEYPRKGIHSIGFITATLEPGEQHNKTDTRLYSIFVPTAPNPTSGYYIMLPADDVKELDISVEDAFRLIVSAGLATNKVENNE